MGRKFFYKFLSTLKKITDAHDEIALLRNKMADDETIKLDEIVDMINNMDNRVSKLEADVFKLK